LAVKAKLKVPSVEYAPLYLQVKDALADKIRNDFSSDGSRLPSERDLSQAFRVSRATIRQALAELEKEHYLDRRQGSGTVVRGCRPAARTGNIGFLFGWEREALLRAPYYSDIYQVVEREASGQQCRVILVAKSIFERHDVEWLKNHVDGMLVTEITDAGLCARLRETGIPCVFINCSCPGNEAMHTVEVDNEGAASAAVEYLISREHRRIGFLSQACRGDEHPVFRERLKGYRQALNRHGLSREAGLEAVGALDYHNVTGISGGYSAAARLMKSAGEMPTAVFACNDLIALGAMQAFRDAGMSVPDDIGIMGFDDIEAAGRATPPLTTMRVDREKIGLSAVRELAALVNGVSNGGSRESIEAQLVPRESVRKLSDMRRQP